jgi:hypothetical protein
VPPAVQFSSSQSIIVSARRLLVPIQKCERSERGCEGGVAQKAKKELLRKKPKNVFTSIIIDVRVQGLQASTKTYPIS